MIQNYRQILESILTRHPQLIIPLKKTCAALNAGQHTVTVGECMEFDRVCMNELFPGAISLRGDKFVLDTESLRRRIPDFTSWIEAATTLADIGEIPKADLSDAVDEIIIELKYKFPRMAFIEVLKQNTRELKSDITRDGREFAVKRISDALNAVKFLKGNTQSYSASKLGAELCKNSKILRKGTRLRYWTALLLAAELGLSETDGEECLKRCGLLENMTASYLTVYGPFVYYCDDIRFEWIKQLYLRKESTMLSMDNLRWISRLSFECIGREKIVLCENESPFNQLLRENTASVYTAGFPNSAVKKFISLLSGDFELLHWGDTDPEGLEIAALLNDIKPVKLYRCEVEDCKRLKHALKELDARKYKRAVQLLASYNFPFRRELEFTINNGWLEQEAWKPFEQEN